VIGRAALIGLALGALPALASAQAVVAAKTLRPGAAVADGDLVAGPDGTAGDVAAMVGLEVRRAVYQGRAVTPADLGPPTLVKRNAIVRVIYRTGGLAIRTEGRALDDGGAGERVRVMNLASRQTVIGTVSAPGLVEVGR